MTAGVSEEKEADKLIERGDMKKKDKPGETERKSKGEEGNERRGRDQGRGGMVRKAKLSKRKREWIVNVRGEQADL